MSAFQAAKNGFLIDFFSAGFICIVKQWDDFIFFKVAFGGFNDNRFDNDVLLIAVYVKLQNA